MNTECVVPEWLHDTFLGYGDADAAHYPQMPNQITALDFKDTFLSLDHLRDSFPKYSIKVRAKIRFLYRILDPSSLTLSLSAPLMILIVRCLHSSQLMIIMADVDAQILPLFFQDSFPHPCQGWAETEGAARKPGRGGVCFRDHTYHSSGAICIAKSWPISIQPTQEVRN